MMKTSSTNENTIKILADSIIKLLKIKKKKSMKSTYSFYIEWKNGICETFKLRKREIDPENANIKFQEHKKIREYIF